MNDNVFNSDSETSLNKNKPRKKHQKVTTDMVRRVRKLIEKDISIKIISDDLDLSLKNTYIIANKISRGLSDDNIATKNYKVTSSKESIVKTRISELLLKNSAFTQYLIKRLKK